MLEAFDMRAVQGASTCVFIGRRATGKSFALRDALYHLRDIPVGVVISPTESAEAFYGKFVPSVLIYDEYTPEIVATFVERQRNITALHDAEIAHNGRTDIDPRAFIVLDSCLYDNNWGDDANIRFLFTHGRECHAFVALTVQYAMQLPQQLHAHVDYAFLCRENIPTMREKLYRQYRRAFPSFDAFNQVFTQCIHNQELLVVDCRADQAFAYKACPRQFQMCRELASQVQEDVAPGALQEVGGLGVGVVRHGV